jgi:hypothetical protein
MKRRVCSRSGVIEVTKWLDLEWYRYLWHRRTPLTAKILIVLLLLLAMLGGGYLAASRLASASGGTTADAYILQSTTVTKVVTVRKHGRIIIKRYPVVHTIRVKAKTETLHAFQTITTPGGTKIVPVIKLRYVPVTRTVSHSVTSIVKVNGKTRTVVTTKSVTVPQTQTQVVTDAFTVTNQSTQTNNITNEHTNTVVTTRLVTTTVVSEPVTSTVVSTNEVTTTVVRTTTETQTLPQITVTQTITAPSSVP